MLLFLYFKKNWRPKSLKQKYLFLIIQNIHYISFIYVDGLNYLNGKFETIFLKLFTFLKQSSQKSLAV
jgi:hypothetical protein